MPLGCDYHNDAFTLEFNHSSQTIRVLLEGLLDGFVEGLGVVGGVGVGFDPCVSVPGLVVEVSEVLGVSLDCARYFLQVLALVCPSDVCVRRWNGWGSGDIRGVGEVLAGRGLWVGGCLVLQVRVVWRCGRCRCFWCGVMWCFVRLLVGVLRWVLLGSCLPRRGSGIRTATNQDSRMLPP